MPIFERWFRSRFVPEGDSYLYWVREGAVRFEPGDVEALVAEWRQIVANPLVWVGWVLLGAALPLWMIWQGGDVQAFGIALAVVANTALVVTLVYADGVVGRAAETRMLDRPDEGVPQPSLVANLIWVAVLGSWAWQSVSEFYKSPGAGIFELGMTLLFAGAILLHIYQFLRNWRRWRAQLSGK
ncbi:hypothetical protein [Sphingomonas sp. KR3-1]|uniref:hypothetical protein n=1 Tax=Sphingomonas sp. KR3-1 TaxID=3156611 RepID=UPI0032B36C72